MGHSDTIIGYSDTIKRLLHGGYPDAKNVYPNMNEAIRILEDSIRMPATLRSRTANNKSK